MDGNSRSRIPIRRALVSVSDKSGLESLASGLAEAGVEIVSTGSTAKLISSFGLPVTEVSELTGFPESLGGRVKTLHPAVHAGILADLRLDSHREELSALGISPFELIVVNLYPFVETVASGAAPAEVIEQIDIGGPAMVRSAAKNHANVAIVTSPESYPQILSALAAGGTTLDERTALAARAFAHTAAYDMAVASYFRENLNPATSEEPPKLKLEFGSPTALRYGENSHQKATLYRAADGHGIAQAKQLSGKEMSYNNYLDADAALRAAFDFEEPAVAVVKHNNPCGIAVGETIAAAHRLAHECDPVSAYGGVIAANCSIDLDAANSIRDIFTEVVVAPDFSPEALELLSAKKNLRILKLPSGFEREAMELRQVSGGMLRQDADRHFAAFETWRLVSGAPAGAEIRRDLEFAWRAVRAVKSNAILLAKGGASIGVGMGQVNRVDSCRLAVSRAGDRVPGSVAASDAFFPFADGLSILIDAGVTAVVQPGGSIRDEEVVEAASRAGITMYFTSERHFNH
ncbi:MAG: bifunctional phosphoribosylaminoimidazolecarboxamide formyltransferase/IMP cyclohydrolase [Cryobacterium sp.]|nr:bifunctional phosphoribosylaminoimidazolecarboxamide formyltransferase/IMP cyclohydrolase [Cryobacterium sp.]